MSDIQELMNRDPMKLTNEDITQVIEWMRENRRLFKNTPASGGSSVPKKTAKEAAVAKLDLGDLNL